jgi:hypothetical protein
VDPGGLECEAGDLVYQLDEDLSESGGDVTNAGGDVVKGRQRRRDSWRRSGERRRRRGGRWRRSG